MKTQAVKKSTWAKAPDFEVQTPVRAKIGTVLIGVVAPSSSRHRSRPGGGVKPKIGQHPKTQGRQSCKVSKEYGFPFLCLWAKLSLFFGLLWHGLLSSPFCDLMSGDDLDSVPMGWRVIGTFIDPEAGCAGRNLHAQLPGPVFKSPKMTMLPGMFMKTQVLEKLTCTIAPCFEVESPDFEAGWGRWRPAPMIQ